MKQKRRAKKPTNVVVLMNDTVLATGILHILSEKKNLQIDRFMPESQNLAEALHYDQAEVVILSATGCPSESPECLMTLIASPSVKEILMVNPDSNVVQVFKKQQITLTGTQDFAKLF